MYKLVQQNPRMTRNQYEAAMAETRRVSLEWYQVSVPKIVRDESWKNYRKSAAWERFYQRNKKNQWRIWEIRSRINASY
jgi:hypothetical protein